ncbi:MAG: hypothetical protein IH624_13395, partial [Phycisphaerae bacterium]|nr:hypothetical protein [Phycisphaerae bacterium]
MVRRFLVSPRLKDLQVVAVLTVLAVFSTVSTHALGQPTTREEAMTTRAQKTLQIAQEYVGRKVYKQAEILLSSLHGDGELAEFVSDTDKEIVASLGNVVQQALAERTRIANVLMESDQLGEQGQYAQAVERLASVRNSEYLRELEREQIDSSLALLQEKAKTQPKAAAPAVAKPVVEQVAPEAKPAAVQAPVVVPETRAYVVPAPEAVVPVVREVAVSPEAPQVTVVEAPPVAAPVATKAAAVAPEVVQVSTKAAEAVAAPVPAQTPVAAEIKPAAVEPIAAANTEQAQADADADAEDSYVRVVTSRQNRLRNYTKAVVDDSVAKASEYLAQKEFEAANSSLDRAFSTVEINKVLLGDELYRQYSARLNIIRNQIKDAHRMDILNKERIARDEAETMTQTIRRDMEAQRAQAVADYLERSYAFQTQQRFEEALGQLEQLLAIDPTHKTALIQKATLERTIGYRTELELAREKERRELTLLRHTMKAEIPYHEEISYPKNWIELTARRKEEGFTSRDPVDAAVYRQLEQVVDLSLLTEDTTFAEAMNVIRNAVDPPLPIVIMWNDIRDNAFIDKTNVIGIPGEGLSSVALVTGLKRVIEAVGGSGDLAQVAYVVDKGLITVATKDYLPTEYKPIVYDVAELLSTPAGLSGMG